MKKQKLQITPIISAAFNLLIGAVIIWALTMIVILILRFYNEAKGLLYAKDFKEYLDDISNNIQKHKWTNPELQKFADLFNQSFGENRIILKSNGTSIENTIILKNQLQMLLNDKTTNAQTIKAILFVAGQGELKFFDISVTPHVKEFIISAAKFAQHIDIDGIINDIQSGSNIKPEILMYMIKSAGAWFTDISGDSAIWLLVFIIAWGVAIIFSIANKLIRFAADLKAGMWLVFWAIMMPIFGFIFYPLISLKYLFKNKVKNSL
ncbi:hypothetical protein MYMA111404_02155 [Mycoplasma marinum]|uniref:Uncharacterized protein n=1 Tax=Mycoplasma marinum TaxID=1937190 RepID=A0A4R0XPA4_9MOLU|nr:hypothetical protein [Mycoplasma marinum]TCG11352.1 hypothetical protein C4B24_02260 [Mycoplasma marinum]